MTWTDVVKLVLPLLAGGFGAFAGGRLALHRYKSERAHDRLIDWYDKANRALIIALQNVDATLDELMEATELDNQRQADRDKLFDELDVVLDGAVMYARPTTLAHIANAQRKAKLATQRMISPAEREISRDEQIHTLRQLRRVVADAHLRIGVDGRNELLGKDSKLDYQQLLQLRRGHGSRGSG